MYLLAEGIALSVEVSDSSENSQVEAVEIDRASVKVGMFQYRGAGRDHQICARRRQLYI